MQKINYQLQTEAVIRAIGNASSLPHLVLHSCCAPCSSYCLEYLTPHFNITVVNYNPNLYPQREMELRAVEQKRLIDKLPHTNHIDLVEVREDAQVFYDAVRGLEEEKEGGARCTVCFVLRLEKTARIAKELGADWFTTTLSISPRKDAHKLNTLGLELGVQYGISYLPSDFKKKQGYARSVELSALYGLYRQDYCGCAFSKCSRI